MSVEEIILYLRQQLLELRGENDRQAISELLSTFKMLTKIAFENNDKQLIAVLVTLTDAARDLYLNHPLTGTIPTEAEVRQAVSGTKTQAVSVAAPALSANGGSAALTETRQIHSITTQEIGALEASFDHESMIQRQLRAVANRDWTDHSHIRDGSKRQMQAYSVVYDELMLFHHLADHAPLWAGTYPIDLDTETSDIDIICNPDSLRPFLMRVKSLYETQPEFRLTWKAIDRVPTVVARFACQGFAVELFAQPRPTASQQAFIHMVVEARLLAFGGAEARQGIRALKREGHSTESAFLTYFKIHSTDPYEKLLALARLDDDALRRQINITIEE